MTERISATTFDLAELKTIVDDLVERYDGPGKLHDLVKERRKSYHGMNPPTLPKPYESAYKFETDLPRRSHAEQKARLIENPWTVQVATVKSGPKKDDARDRLEKVLNTGILSIDQKASRQKIQGALSDGQIVDYGGWLHWCMKSYGKPKDYEYADELPEDEDERKRYRDVDEDDEEDAKKANGKKYRQTDEDWQRRRGEEKAKQGFPFMVYTPDPLTVYPLPDESSEAGYGMVLWLREVGLLDYAVNLKREGIAVSMRDTNSKVRVYVEEDAPTDDAPDASGWKHRVKLAQLWTRDECYEMVMPSSGGDWELVKSFKHPYEMPPFALAPAYMFNDSSPALSYKPTLEGVFKLKKAYDYAISLWLVIAEQIALPYYYLQEIGTGQPMLNDDGTPVMLSRNSAAAREIPSGYELKKVEFELNPAFQQGLAFLKEEIGEAVPPSGQAEASASTQPWALRLQQEQANVQPSMLVGLQAQAMQVMAQNMALVMGKSVEDGGFGEGVYVSTRDNPAVTGFDVVGVEPEEIEGLYVGVNISATSAAERITKVEHGRELLNDPKVPLTRERFLDEYMGVSDPSEWLEEFDAEQLDDMYVKPGQQRQIVAEWLGLQVVLGADLASVGPNGQAVDPRQVLMANGWQSAQPQGMSPGVQQQVNPQMPSLPGQEVPGTMPMPGRMG